MKILKYLHFIFFETKTPYNSKKFEIYSSFTDFVDTVFEE